MIPLCGLCVYSAHTKQQKWSFFLWKLVRTENHATSVWHLHHIAKHVQSTGVCVIFDNHTFTLCDKSHKQQGKNGRQRAGSTGRSEGNYETWVQKWQINIPASLEGGAAFATTRTLIFMSASKTSPQPLYSICLSFCESNATLPETLGIIPAFTRLTSNIFHVFLIEKYLLGCRFSGDARERGKCFDCVQYFFSEVDVAVKACAAQGWSSAEHDVRRRKLEGCCSMKEQFSQLCNASFLSWKCLSSCVSSLLVSLHICDTLSFTIKQRAKLGWLHFFSDPYAIYNKCFISLNLPLRTVTAEGQYAALPSEAQRSGWRFILAEHKIKTKAGIAMLSLTSLKDKQGWDGSWASQTVFVSPNRSAFSLNSTF